MDVTSSQTAEGEEMKKVTSLELSKKLKEAGAKRDSEYVYVKDNQDGYLISRRWLVQSFPQTHPSAFDCTELLYSLPRNTVLERYGDEFIAHCVYGVNHTEKSTVSPAEVLGQLKLWCLEEGHEIQYKEITPLERQAQ